LKNAETAEAVRAAADGQDAVVLSVEKVQKITAPPKLYDLTTLQREANRIFGFTAQQTLDYAQSLYEKKLLTYPRTDSRYITEDMRGTVAGYFGKDDPKPNIDAIINNAKVTDHHALLPTSVCADVSQLDKMSSGECKILKLVTERLVCAVSPIHVYETVTAVLECGGHKFTAKGKTIITDGWTGVTPDTMSRTARDEKDAALPELVEGQVFQSVSASVKEGKTSPPKRYTEDTLLSAMENAGQRDAGLNIGSAEDDGCGRFGLGTPATRAATIEKLIKSGVVERQKKNLIPTQKGINLIAVLPDSVKSPLLTANWEQKLRLVERGELSEDTFMDGITDMTRKLVADHAAPIEEYKDLFAAASDNRCVTKRDTPQIGVCPRCGSGVAERQKGFFCSNRNCSFALWKDNRFFEAKKKKLTKTVAAALLNEGRVFFSDLYSERMGKTYAASVVLEDIDGKVKFKVIFDGSDSK
jgi:DNA topoisomerase-3